MKVSVHYRTKNNFIRTVSGLRNTQLLFPKQNY
jgi:hypothetical protein